MRLLRSSGWRDSSSFDAASRFSETGVALLGHGIEDGLADMGLIEQRLDIRIERLLSLDGLRMDAAENQQMVIFGQIVQRAHGGLETLVRREKAK